jgi:hypothetical protein
LDLFAVAPHEDEAFLASWIAAAPPGETLYRALRADVPFRYASLPIEAREGVMLIVPLDHGFEPAWEGVRDVLSTRQGFLAAHLLHDVAVVHWSSPLMYARAVREEGDPVAALPLRSQPVLYVRA